MNVDRRGVDGAEVACERFDAVLPELIGLDGEQSTLSSTEKEALSRHGETCARCAESRRAYAATVDLLRGLPRKGAPSDFLAWVKEALPEANARAGPWRRSRKPWVAIAAAVPLLAAATYLAVLDGSRPPPEIAMAPAPSPSEPSRDLVSKGAVPPAEPPAAIWELHAPKDFDAARFEEAAPRSPPDETVIALALPYVAGRWERDLASLEREVRGRFVDPPRSAAPASRRATQPSPEAPRGVAQPAPAEGQPVTLEDRGKRENVDRRAVPAPIGTREARSTAAAVPEVREIAVSVDPARLAELRTFVDAWSARRLRMQTRGARPQAELEVEEKLEASPRSPVTVRIRIEPLLPASADPKSP